MKQMIREMRHWLNRNERNLFDENLTSGALRGNILQIIQTLICKYIQQNLTNDSAKVNMMPVLQHILLDENLKFLRVKVQD